MLPAVIVLTLYFVASSAVASPTDQQSSKECPDNELYVDCLLGVCKPKICSDLGKNMPCASIAAPCAGGCVCEDGYVRNGEGGECVPEHTCPKPTCHENEVYTACALGQCQPKLCFDIGRSLGCPSISGYCPGACLCTEGFLRSDEGKCIPQETCPKPCKEPHTHYTACMPRCEVSSCRQLAHPPPAGCGSFQLECHVGCACDDGYLRDDTGRCVLRKQCDSGSN